MARKVFHAVGKRKNAIARVYLKEGSGSFSINGRSLETYFRRPTSRMVIEHALKLTDNAGKFDINVNVCGGGLSGQADAIRHGIARALQIQNVELRPVLKRAGLLTRDSRIKERKKYGLASARARFQFSKR